MLSGAATKNRNAFFVGTCLLFLFLALSMTGSVGGMFADIDSLWHLAAGDLIRESGKIPATDPWSFTAGDYPWFNIAWLWDIGLSIIYQDFGWHGTAAINAIIVALTFSLIFYHCLLRSDDLIASTLATLGTFFIILPLLRPLQVSNFMVALWFLILSSILRKECSARWLLLFPPLMLVWVNMHGGFAAGALLLIAFFAQAVYLRDRLLAKQLFITGIFSFAAIFCNPLGFGIIEGFLRVMNDTAQPIINEWQPVSFTAMSAFENILAIVFLVMVPGRRLPILRCERYLAYFWLMMGIMSTRHMSIFVIFAAPILSTAIAAKLSTSKSTPNAQAVAVINRLLALLNQKAALRLALAACVAVCVWLPTHSAAKFYKQETFTQPSFAEETRFIKTHYPHAHLLTEFYISAFLIYETRGALPVFIDSRTQTAYPSDVIKDYIAFLKNEAGWEKMLEKYKLSGALLPNNPGVRMNTDLLERLSHAKGWRMAHQGPNASLFIYNPK